ncbi:hypothetical protein MNQ95_09880 [Pseudoxanthomonas daejeonensis]|uniref:Alanine acetyltransferase n=1 Tax=Pseudoxanthomonas daejeonensis TaxID=266062 RepID=A0ABQ6ZB12_9GAMM|nr:hypothetical protein [Pseudoxanthomonas daejeonensis]KAF1697065.1 hypothetical protein CSC65_02495 [Pseudoxanthomonas daejeonensis]UNK56478.1 hypothetical protein MNQ95_09880 [Pseudoxanthomonas daejeonensis]
MNGEASPWSPEQRRWLQALGHVVLRPRAAGEEEHDLEPVARQAGTQAPAPRSTPARLPAAPVDAAPVVKRAPQAPVAPVVELETPEAASPRAVARRPARLPDRLQLAMLRASGLDPADPAAQAAMAQWPMDHLRGDAAAKRAFWPQLRALRKRP